MTYPLISVLMPAYNAGKYIKAALDSIIATRYPNLEIIVINDGSTDNTAEVVENYPFPIRLYHQENKGIPITRNRIFDLMTGDIFTFLDADDLWAIYKFKVQLPLLDDADMVFGQSQFINHHQPFASTLLASGLYRRSTVDVVGRFAEDLPIGEDTDWVYRAWEAELRFVLHKNTVHWYRRHPTNTTRNIIATQKVSFQMVKRSLDRRRKTNNWSDKRLIEHMAITPSDEEFMKKDM
jgi:glycosyltransferase involved in cell wall biosynthesis